MSDAAGLRHIGLEPQSGCLLGRVHRLPIRVYYEDTDAGGIVYYANYLKFMERGRSDMLRLAGIDQVVLMKPGDGAEPLMFVIRRCEVDYLRPARLDDRIVVETRLVEWSGARLDMEQTIRREDDLLVTARIHAAVVGSAGRARRLPPKIRHILTALVCSADAAGEPVAGGLDRTM